MNRRDFLKSLAGLPLLGFLKPEEVKAAIPEPSKTTMKAYSLEMGREGELYISGNFLLEDIEQVRQRHYDYYRLIYDGESFSTLK